MIHSVDISPDGKLVATGSWDGTARIWDSSTGKPMTDPLPHGAEVYSVSFSPDGTRLATAANDGKARMWEVATGKFLAKPMPHYNGAKGVVSSVKFNRKGDLLATASEEGAGVWDVLTGDRKSLISNAAGNEVNRIYSIEFSLDGTLLATGDAKGGVNLWNPLSGSLMKSMQSHGAGAVYGLRFSPAPTPQPILAAGWEDGTVIVYDSSAAEGSIYQNATPGKRVNDLDFSRDGRILAVGFGDGDVLLWNAASSDRGGEPLQPRFPARISRIQFSPTNPNRLATSGFDGVAKIWDVNTRQVIGSQMAHTDSIYCLEYSRDGSRIVTGSYDFQAKVWNAETGALIAPVP